MAGDPADIPIRLISIDDTRRWEGTPAEEITVVTFRIGTTARFLDVPIPVPRSQHSDDADLVPAARRLFHEMVRDLSAQTVGWAGATDQ